MDKNNHGEWKRSDRIKRQFEHVISIECFDVWNNPPTKAIVRFKDSDHGWNTSNPVKINQRKNGTFFVQFEGHRYDIDVTKGNKTQFISTQ